MRQYFTQKAQVSIPIQALLKNMADDIARAADTGRKK